MSHTCHWPGCEKEVPPAKWGCASHWFTLPRDLRNRVWAAYVPGQEITKTPSPEYLAVAREVRAWALDHERNRQRAAELLAGKAAAATSLAPAAQEELF